MFATVTRPLHVGTIHFDSTVRVSSMDEPRLVTNLNGCQRVRRRAVFQTVVFDLFAATILLLRKGASIPFHKNKDGLSEFRKDKTGIS